MNKIHNIIDVTIIIRLTNPKPCLRLPPLLSLLTRLKGTQATLQPLLQQSAMKGQTTPSGSTKSNRDLDAHNYTLPVEEKLSPIKPYGKPATFMGFPRTFDKSLAIIPVGLVFPRTRHISEH